MDLRTLTLEANNIENSDQTAQSAGGANDIDIEAIWKLLKLNWAWSFAFPALVAIAAYAGTYLIQTEYRGSVVMTKSNALESLSGRGGGNIGSALGGLSSLQGLGLSFGNEDINVYLAELQSRNLLLEFIKQKDLKRGLFPDRWDEDAKRWIAAKSDKPDEKGAPGDWETFEEMETNIDISRDFEAGTISLNLYWSDPQTAATLANELVNLLNSRARDRQMREAEDSIAYLRDSIGTTENTELRKAMADMTRVQLERYLVARGVTDFLLRVIDPAIPPIKAARPRRVVIASLALIIAAIISIGTVLLTSRRRVSY